MENWQIEIVNKAFKRCYGLKELVKNKNADAIKELSTQTGLRYSFLLQNIDTLTN
jgi:hypothetical protein